MHTRRHGLMPKNSVRAWLLLPMSALYASGWFYSAPVEAPPLVVLPDLTPTLPPMDCVPPQDQFARNIYYCPEAIDLRLGPNYTWFVSGNNWISDKISASTSILRFQGAHYSGNNVGVVTCLYLGNNLNDFPIPMRASGQIMEPGLPVWKKNAEGSYDCVTVNNQVCDCPFQLFQPPTQPTYMVN